MRISNRSLFKPRARGPYRIENKASVDESTVYIYDEIGWFGIMPEQFNKDFNAIKSSTIHIRFNTPGGAVFDGTAIFNTIKQSKAHTVGHIDGLAASIGSVIALAVNELRMAENAFFMIHDPFSITIGTARDMRDEADLLDKVAGTIAKVYMDKTGKDEAEIKDMMAAETWMTAQEAFDNGFIDEIEKEDKKSDKSRSVMFDLSAYANVPDALKASKDTFTARDVEGILRDAGVSVKQAKAILSEGYKEELRDVAPPVEDSPARDLRDVDTQEVGSVADVLRDVKQSQQQKEDEKKDKVADLLERAELIAPSSNKPVETVSNPNSYILFTN